MQTPEEILQQGFELCQNGNLTDGIIKFRQALDNNPRPGTKMVANHNIAYALTQKAGVVWGPGGRVPVNANNIASLDEALNRWNEVCKIYQHEVEGTPEEVAFSAEPSLKEYMKTAMNNGFAISVKLDQFRGEGAFKKKAEPDKKSGCFIATAAFEDELSPEVTFLRQYRDNILNKSRKGRIFVHAYYVVSPSIARVISTSTVLKRVTRKLFLRPAIKLLSYIYSSELLNKRR